MYSKYFSEDRFMTYLSWYYNFEDCILAHETCYKRLKLQKNRMMPINLLKKSFCNENEKGNREAKNIVHISSSLVYSLIGAIFIDSNLNLNKTREVTLNLISPLAEHLMGEGIVEEFAPLKLERYCMMKGWEKPKIIKETLNEHSSFRFPASSEYHLFIGKEKYSSLIEVSLKRAEYALYVMALEKLQIL